MDQEQFRRLVTAYAWTGVQPDPSGFSSDAPEGISGLTHSDIKLISYLKLNLSSKEIAPLLNLSVRGVEASRYRILKKMNLSGNINLTEFILKY
jgi:DNA-binding NarL/FixJ family response regulator